MFRVSVACNEYCTLQLSVQLVIARDYCCALFTYSALMLIVLITLLVLYIMPYVQLSCY